MKSIPWLVIITFIFLQCKMPEEQNVATLAGQQRKEKLPDGSSVTLNAVTKLGWSPGTWEQERYVVLEGEAYFETKKGKRFAVRTEQGQVEVVGTTFNVYARDKTLEVQCTSGKVQVKNPDGTQTVLLKTGEQVTVQDGWMQRRHGLHFYPAWFKGESAFRDAPLQRVLDEMERQYSVVIAADSIGNKTFSGKFGHKDLEKALVAVCRPVNLTYLIKGDTVLLNFK